jgi:hypothetical protein
VSEPAAAEVGSAEGVVLDLRLAEGQDEAYSSSRTLFEDSEGAWVVEPDRPSRIWIVDVDGEAVMIVTDAPERAFDNWVAVVEEALSTVEWGG